MRFTYTSSSSSFPPSISIDPTLLSQNILKRRQTGNIRNRPEDDEWMRRYLLEESLSQKASREMVDRVHANIAKRTAGLITVKQYGYPSEEDIDQHNSLRCKCIREVCDDCGTMVKGCAVWDHKEVCTEAIVECPLKGIGCGETFKRKHSPQHYLQCKFYYVQCHGDLRGHCNIAVTRQHLFEGDCSHFDYYHAVKVRSDLLLPDYSKPFQGHPYESPSLSAFPSDIWNQLLILLDTPTTVALSLTSKTFLELIHSRPLSAAKAIQFVDLDKPSCSCGVLFYFYRSWKAHFQKCPINSTSFCWFCKTTISGGTFSDGGWAVHYDSLHANIPWPPYVHSNQIIWRSPLKEV